MRSDILLFGVAGLMGSGKSSLCRKLQEHAAKEDIDSTLIEVDKLRAEIIESDSQIFQETQQAIKSKYGSRILRQDGKICRSKLAEITYGIDREIQSFEAIIDPVIRSLLQLKIEEVKTPLAFVEHALLVEKKLLPEVNFNLIIVDCPLKEILARLKNSDLPMSQIEKRISLQLPYTDRLTISMSLANDHDGEIISFNSLTQTSVEVWSKIKARLGSNG